MPYYLEEITIPANTTKASPQETYMELCAGYIKRGLVCFPDGCFELAKVQIFRYEHQLYPATPGASFHWNNRCFEWEDNFPLLKVPHRLKIITWNEDDSYEHDIQVHIEIAEIDIITEIMALIKRGFRREEG